MKPIKFLSSGSPVTGVDIERFANIYKLDGLEFNYVFGLSQATYQRNIKESRDEPVSNVSLAILTRYYEEIPGALEKLLVPDITPQEVLDQMNAGAEKRRITSRIFSIDIGKNASYSTRVVNSGQDISRSSVVSRLLLAIAHDIEHNGAGVAVERLRRIANTEAGARGVYDFESIGGWNDTSKNKDDKDKK